MVKPFNADCKLKRGAISRIARLTGINIHTVRSWVKYGEPAQSKLSAAQQDSLRKAIEIHTRIAKEL